ncbi:hypothetical protein HGO37_19375 [Rhizobium sp. CG4]|uniref:hypothetical protein n=1 Tax=Rhizobium sp. CG4 TaxID=2726075 RepID=UPI002033742B|nr:hypothetical protein [Rhizobium sp. CG4]MCM2457565.1 hypothetical protein [Rhizobium sp. CG4]
MSPEPSLKYVVVEHAGYQGEQDVFSHTDFNVAAKWLTDWYTDFEVKNMHIDIACDLPNGDRTYEI